MHRSMLTVGLITLVACTGDATGSNQTFDNTVNASFVMNMTETHQLSSPAGPGCTRQWTVTGNVVLKYSQQGASGIKGEVSMDHAVKTLISSTPGTVGGCPTTSSGQSVDFGGEVTGTASNFSFSTSQVLAGPGGGSLTDAKSFTGSIANGAVTGTFTYTQNGVLGTGNGTDTQSSTATVPLTFH